MSDLQAVSGHVVPDALAAVPGPVGATQRRVSADSFRSLTARLKKQDAVAAPFIPSLPLAHLPEVAPVAAEPVATIEVAEPLVQSVDAAEAYSEAEVAENESVAASESIEPEIDEQVTPIEDPIFTPEVEAEVEEQPPLELPEQVEDAPVAAWSAMDPLPAELELKPWQPSFALEAAAEAATPVRDATPEPTPTPTPTPAPAPPRVHDEIFVGLVANSPAHHLAKAAHTEPVAPVEPDAPNRARQALARLKEQARSETEDTSTSAPTTEEKLLEHNWRLLLAKPTIEDRAVYLREAVAFAGEQPEFEQPAAEHDLSNIAPAAVQDDLAVENPEASVDANADTEPLLPSVTQIVQQLPIPEGQDLPELARSLLDMMAAGAASGLPHERALAADTLLRLVPRLETKPLVMLAERLSKMDAPPALLVAKLIRDQRVEVSGPLLEDCMHITDRDLESVVAEKQPGKLRMIARRRRLTRSISDALIRTDEPSVLLTLVRNMEAEISHDGFTALVAAAAHHADLLAPLSTRPDLGAPFAFELFWAAPAQLRRYLLSRFLTDSETLTKILKITLATKDKDNPDAEPMSQHVVLEAFERAVRGKVDQAADEIAATLELTTATVQRVLNDQAGEAIVVLLKAAGYARSAVPGLLRKMRDAELPLISPEREVDELQNLFETLSFNKAKILLTYWDWAQRKTGPYAPVH